MNPSMAFNWTGQRSLLLTVLFASALAWADKSNHGSANISAWKPTYETDKPVSEKHKKQVQEAVPKVPIIQPTSKRKVLVYSATGGARHGSIPIGNFAFNELGRSSGAYEAVVSNDPENFEPEVLKTFDAVILLNSTGNIFMPCTHSKNSIRDQFSNEEWKELKARDKRLVGNLIDYVRSGGGLVGIHAATDAYYGHMEFRKMIGGTFWGHPWTAGQNVTINVEEPDHALVKPVFGDMKSIAFKEEIYQVKDPYSRENCRVLLSLDVEKSDKPKGSEMRREDGDYAVAWIRSEGKGRVFYSSIGHRLEHFWNPLILNHYLSGIQYAAGDLEADATPSTQL